MRENKTTKHEAELLDILSAAAKNKELLQKFLKDLLSPKEYEDIIKRWQIVKELNRGVSHREIVKDLKVAIATVTRGARVLLNQNGGFNEALNKKLYKK